MDYFEECVSLGIEPLVEAGGLKSWVQRLYHGKDDNLLVELDAELKSITTQHQKDAAIAEIDKFISSAEHARDSGSGTDFMMGGVMAVAKRGKNRSSGALHKYVDDLKAARARVEKLKVKG